VPPGLRPYRRLAPELLRQGRREKVEHRVGSPGPPSSSSLALSELTLGEEAE
jgi:hypothetical protein